MSNAPAACSGCMHFVGPSYMRPGECHRHAPVLWGSVEQSMPSGAEARTGVWPIVAPDDVCGEFERPEDG